MNYQQRRARVQEVLREQGLDALLVTRMTNIRYLTAFSGTTAFLVMTDEPFMAVDFRYKEQVAAQVEGVEVCTVNSARELWPAVQKLLAEAGYRRIGIEAAHTTVQQQLELSGVNGGAEWVPTQGIVEQFRVRKEPHEIEAIRQAIEITDDAMEELLGILEPGMTEHRVAGEIERLQRSKGGERSASEIIVASGPRSALPHGIATDRVIAAGEPVMFDLGTVVRGYLADLTRTIHMGAASDEFRRIYDVVLEAQSRAEAAVRPGVTGRDVDAVARDYLTAQGYGEMFGHSLGHSIGLDNHETPLLGPFDDTVLEPGMVFTVEPGVYVSGVGGVRIENVVVVTEDGRDVLTGSPKELMEL